MLSIVLVCTLRSATNTRQTMRWLYLFATLTLALGQEVLVWEDNFDTFDMTKWDHEITAWGGGNSEFQVYTDDPVNSYVQNGILYLRPSRLVDNTNPLTTQPFGDEFLNSGTLDLVQMYGRCTNPDNEGCTRVGGAIPPIMSARIRSFERFSFTYGRVVIRARMPTGDWLWPAMWLLPELWEYGGWPVSGEIDICEIKGNENFRYADGVWAGHQHMGSTLHWGPNWDQNRYYLTTAGKINETSNYGRSWHMYEMDWSEDGFRFIIDGDEFLNIPNPLIPSNPSWTGFWDFGAPYPPEYSNPGWDTPMAPFDKDFHFILNVAVGGTNWFFPDDGTNRDGDPQYTKPWSNNEWYYDAFHSFYNRQDDWYWTWTKEGDGNAMQVDYVQVYQTL